MPPTKHGQRQYTGHGDQPYFLRALRYSPGIAQLLARTSGGLNTTYDVNPTRLSFNVTWKKSVEAAPINAKPTTTAGSCRTMWRNILKLSFIVLTLWGQLCGSSLFAGSTTGPNKPRRIRPQLEFRQRQSDLLAASVRKTLRQSRIPERRQ